MPEMIYRKLGKTGLNASVVGFGASPLGAEFGAIDPEEGRRAVHYAIDCGINYFDVAPYYGRTLAETRLGEFLQGKRDKVILATKACRYGITPEEGGFDYSAKRVMASIDESLRRLRTDHVDILQIHDVEYAPRAQIVNETLPALYKLREQGKTRFVGITGYPLTPLAALAETQPVDTVLTYCRYNLLDMTMDRFLTPVARKKGVGLINASPLHMRVLTEKGAPDWHPAPQRVIDAAAQAACLCSAQGVDIADLAMQFALAHKDVAVTLVGMSKTRHVDTNVKVAGTAPDPVLLAQILNLFKPVADVYWKEALPENDDPGAVNKRTLGLEREAVVKKG
ncbi:MAG: aldo/keto reductase [Candidatus Sumerlaeota bacterium]|nr:aldo/keto reductase [Candidatus Sumerlaeota bacterium]